MQPILMIDLDNTKSAFQANGIDTVGQVVIRRQASRPLSKRSSFADPSLLPRLHDSRLDHRLHVAIQLLRDGIALAGR